MVNCQVRVSGHRTTRFVSLLSAKGNCHDRRECMACQVVYQRHLLYLSSYKTACQRLYTYTIGTHGPAAYSGVAANTITIPCTIGHHTHSSCPPWLSFISTIFQAQLGASCLAGCQKIQGSKCQVTAHRLLYVATQSLSVYCLQKELSIAENSMS